MFPLQDNIPSRTAPVCNWILIVLCTLVFFAQSQENPDDVSLVEKYGMIPARISHPGEPVTITTAVDIVMTPSGPQPVRTTGRRLPPRFPPG